MRVIVPDTGSGYGGKHTGEAAVEAARLAKAAGKPVKLVWTREEEFTWAYFRPAGLIEDGRRRRQGRQAHRLGVPQLQLRRLRASQRPTRSRDRRSSSTRRRPRSARVRTGPWRRRPTTSPASRLMDELAHALGIDPLAFRLRNLEDPRLRAVLEGRRRRGSAGASRSRAGDTASASPAAPRRAATSPPAPRSPWTAPPGACKVVRAVTAFECGAIVNPDHLRNQVEGAVIMGLGGALFEAIRFENGKIRNPRFSRYQVPRFGDVPKIDVVLLDRKDLPSAGAGETPIVAIAPAIANAIFAASGVRLRSMPLVPQGVVKS